MHNHFNKIKKKYFNNIGDKINLYKELKKIIDSLLVNKIVLDIGSGGHLFYDYSLAKKIIILDLSKTMLDESSNKEIVKVYQDARNMTKIKDKSVDIILIIFALHHINGKSYKESVISLKKTLREADKKLLPDGEIFIVEPILNDLLFLFQKLFYKLTFFILNVFKTDMVFFFNEKTIKKHILSIFSNSNLEVSNVKINGWIDPLLGTFPGLIKIPSFFMPTSIKSFYVKKLGSSNSK
tara:strand:+ start:1075 stop:1788 length:714 start_codon:yes stop_codon:yes gene_type:complete